MIQRNYLAAFLLFACFSSFSQSRFITNQGIKIRINTMGTEDRREGQPLIVFESGYGTPMGHWNSILEGVSGLGPWFAYDRPGIGASDPDDEMPTLKNVSDRLISILNQLHLAPPYVLVGHSLGGAYVRGFAAYYPEKLAGLVIIDPADFTETRENKRLPLLDIGLDHHMIDSLFLKWELKAIENKKTSTLPKSVQEEGEVLECMRKTDFREIRDSPLPNIPVHIITGGRYDTPPRFRATEFNDSLEFRAKMKYRVERWTKVIQSVDKGMLFYSGDAGHFIHHDDPELVLFSIQMVLQDYALLNSEE